ncbi:DNA-directed RNA polymerase subunit beta', partial [Bienertia sinuspersici]
MRFCSPGSLSAYRNLQKKQVHNIEHPSNDEVEYGGQPMSINASGMVLEREVENEVQPMIETDNVAHERESETMIEGSSEDLLSLYYCPNIHLRSRSIEGQQKKLTSMHALWKNALLLSQLLRATHWTYAKDVKDLSRFLGTIARTTEFAPLNYVDWPSVPTHDQIWEYVLEKFMIPLEGRSWVLETVNLSWRGYKPKEDEQSKKNKRNREKLDDMHTMGPSSYAVLRHKLKQEDPNKQEPSKAK